MSNSEQNETKVMVRRERLMKQGDFESEKIMLEHLVDPNLEAIGLGIEHLGVLLDQHQLVSKANHRRLERENDEAVRKEITKLSYISARLEISRKKEILKILKVHSEVPLPTLAESIDVSMHELRRLLMDLGEEGHIKRVECTENWEISESSV